MKPAETLTHSTPQMEVLCVGGEGHGCERIGTFVVSVVHPGQQAVTVDVDLGLLHGRHCGLLDDGVAEAREGAGLGGRREDDMDATSPDAEAEQSLCGGEDVDGVSVDDGIIWKNTKKKYT